MHHSVTARHAMPRGPRRARRRASQPLPVVAWAPRGDSPVGGLSGPGAAVGATRVVPVHPDLVAMLRELTDRDGNGPRVLLLPGYRGGLPDGTIFHRTWGLAREAVLDEHECRSPVGRRVYDLRHTSRTTWLNSDVPPAQVAEWAGNSVPVLLSTYPRGVSGQSTALLQRVEGPRRCQASRSGG